MITMYVFSSTRRTDKCSRVYVSSSTLARAKELVRRKFITWGYKGKPKLAI